MLEGEWFSLALDLNADTAFGHVKFGDDVAKPPVEFGSYLEGVHGASSANVELVVDSCVRLVVGWRHRRASGHELLGGRLL